MRSDRLRVFVSSKMAELAAERAAIKDVLDDLNVDAWVFEQDAGARPETIEESYREQLEASDLYIGVFWKGYGDYTIDEFELARATETDCLIYQKEGAEADGRDQRLQAFLDKIGTVETGLTVQFFDTPEELREMVKRDTARWQTRIVRKYREDGRRGPTGLPADPNLVVLRNKVKQVWIEGVLGRAVAETGGLMSLPRRIRPEAVNRPAKTPAAPAAEFEIGPASRPIEVFEQLGGSLLILGEPGAGKTTTALELARDLIARAERNDSHPVPVVLNLSAWSGEPGALIDWIVRELSRKYHVPEWIGRSWVEQDRLVLVLDGLDEVAAPRRAACCGAINGFVKEHGAEGLVVTSRLDEYEALGARVDLTGAILLEPLAPPQVDAHLEGAGERLAGLRAALTKDPTLRNLARTPLMLSVMSLAYRDRPAEELALDASESPEARSARLFDAYVERAFLDRDSRGRYSREALTSWLSWLARHMAERSRTVFLIEDLQPSWLERRAHLGAYLVGFAGLLGFVFGGLCILYRLNPPMRPPVTPSTLDLRESAVWVFACSLFFLGIALTDGLRIGRRTAPEASVMPGADSADERRDDLRRIVANVVIFGLLWAPIALAMKGLLGPYEGDRFVFQVLVPGAALVMGFAALGARRSVSRRIETAESLALERASALRGARWGLLAGAPFAIATFWAIRASTGMDGSPTPWVGVFWCLMGAAVGAVLAGFRPRLVRGKTVPNQGMVLTLETSLRAATTALPLTALALLAGVALDDFYRQPRLLFLWATVALPFLAVSIAAWFGGLDLAKHHLLRAVIGATRQGPFDFRRFLAEAGRRNLMQRVGGGYMFAHRPLLDRFAALDLPPPLAAEIRDPEAGRSRLGPVAFAVTLAVGLGAILPWVVPEAAVRPVLIAEAVVLGLALQWLVIRSAVASALESRRDPPE